MQGGIEDAKVEAPAPTRMERIEFERVQGIRSKGSCLVARYADWIFSTSPAQGLALAIREKKHLLVILERKGLLQIALRHKESEIITLAPDRRLVCYQANVQFTRQANKEPFFQVLVPALIKKLNDLESSKTQITGKSFSQVILTDSCNIRLQGTLKNLCLECLSHYSNEKGLGLPLGRKYVRVVQEPVHLTMQARRADAQVETVDATGMQRVDFEREPSAESITRYLISRSSGWVFSNSPKMGYEEAQKTGEHILVIAKLSSGYRLHLRHKDAKGEALKGGKLEGYHASIPFATVCHGTLSSDWEELKKLRDGYLASSPEARFYEVLVPALIEKFKELESSEEQFRGESFSHVILNQRQNRPLRNVLIGVCVKCLCDYLHPSQAPQVYDDADDEMSDTDSDEVESPSQYRRTGEFVQANSRRPPSSEPASASGSAEIGQMSVVALAAGATGPLAQLDKLSGEARMGSGMTIPRS